MKIQKKYLLVMLCAVIGALQSFGQETETRSLNSFDGVSVSSSIDAEVMRGSSNQVELIAEGVELEKISTEIENGVLKLGYKKSGKKWSWGGKKRKVKAIVTFNGDLNYVGASSSGDIIVKDVIKGEEVKVSASSSGDVSVEVDARYLTVNASSSGDIEISGSAEEAKIRASSSGDILGEDLNVDDADASASSSGDIHVHVNKSLVARASSGGDIVYSGNPSKKDVKKSSGGDIVHKN